MTAPNPAPPNPAPMGRQGSSFPPPPPPRRGGRGSGRLPEGRRSALPLRWDRVGPWLGLMALCLALFVPGIASLPPIDRDEARFAQASRQMLESGDFIAIHFQDEQRNKKPIGIYWAQAASASLFGGAAAPIWAYRLPSILGALAAVLLVHGLGRRLFDPSTGFLAASLLAASFQLVFEAHNAKTDALLLAATVAAQACLAVIYVQARAHKPTDWPWALGFWAAIGAGILIKGPITPLVSGLTALTLAVADRNGRWLGRLRPLIGVPLAAVIVAPWVVAVQRATAGAFLQQSVGNDLLPKLIAGDAGHALPPGFHLAFLMLGFFPGSLLVVPGLLRSWRERGQPVERFLLAWLLPAWLVFELVPNKLPHYVLPLYPALALLIARVAVVGHVERFRRLGARLSYLLWAVVPIALAALAVAGPWLLEGRVDASAAVAVLAALAALAIVVSRVWAGRTGNALAAAIAVAGVLYATLFQSILPRLDAFWPSRNAALLVDAAFPGRSHPAIAAAGYAEPSLVFLLGTGTLLTTGAGAADRLIEDRRAAALVALDQEGAFQGRLAGAGIVVRQLGETRGYNYSKGRWTSLRLYARADRGEP